MLRFVMLESQREDMHIQKSTGLCAGSVAAVMKKEQTDLHCNKLQHRILFSF